LAEFLGDEAPPWSCPDEDFMKVRAWADAFQTFDWEKAIPVPDVAVKEVGRLLALASWISGDEKPAR